MNGVAPPELAVCTQPIGNQGKSLDELQSMGFNSSGLANSVAPSEHAVWTGHVEAQGKEESQGTNLVEHNTAPTPDQMLDRLPVEEIARYLEKKKNKSLDEDQTKKQRQSTRTRSMSLKGGSEKKTKAK